MPACSLNAVQLLFLHTLYVAHVTCAAAISSCVVISAAERCNSELQQQLVLLLPKVPQHQSRLLLQQVKPEVLRSKIERPPRGLNNNISRYVSDGQKYGSSAPQTGSCSECILAHAKHNTVVLMSCLAAAVCSSAITAFRADG